MSRSYNFSLILIFSSKTQNIIENQSLMCHIDAHAHEKKMKEKKNRKMLKKMKVIKKHTSEYTCTSKKKNDDK